MTKFYARQLDGYKRNAANITMASIRRRAERRGHTLSAFVARVQKATGIKLYDVAHCVKCEAVCFANAIESQTDSVNPAVQRRCLGN